MMEMFRLNDFFPYWYKTPSVGIFTMMDTLFEDELPWHGQVAGSYLNFLYHGNRSGNKIISPLMETCVHGGTGFTDNDFERLVRTIFTLYKDNWEKQWNTLLLEYNPIENYDTTEKMLNDSTIRLYGKTAAQTRSSSHGKTGSDSVSYGSTETRTDNLSHNESGSETTNYGSTETRTDNLSKSQNKNLSGDTNNSVYGFNSNLPSPSDKSTTSEQTTGTETNTGTQSNAKSGNDSTSHNSSESDTGTQSNAKSGTDRTSYNITETDTGTQSITNGGSDTELHLYELKKSGNIGVTTSQRMIELEHQLWAWNFFNDVVFPDVDRILTLQIY